MDLTILATPVVELDDWLNRQSRFPNVPALRAAVKKIFGQNADAVATSKKLAEDRRRLADTVLALSVSPRYGGHERDQVMRALRLCAGLEQLKQGSNPNAKALESVIRAAPVLLPRDAFIAGAKVADPSKSDDAGGDRPKLEAEDHLGDTSTDDATRSVAPEDLSARAAGLGAAARDLRRAFAWEAMSGPRTPLDRGDRAGGNGDGHGAPLSRNAVRRLTPETVATLRLRNVDPESLNVPSVVGEIEDELLAIGDVLAARSPVGTTRFTGSGALTLAPLSPPQPDASGSPASVAQPVPIGHGSVRVLGIAELRTVDQQLQCYRRGEIAHIENTLAGEGRKRVHRRLRTTEETVTTETERIEEEERDLQTAERFEIQREATRTAEEATQLQAGANVTAKYGATVETTANFGFARSDAQSESTRQATTFARDVMDQAVSRLRLRQREERVRRTLEEIEETNTHRIENDGPANATGIYRYLDKVYSAQVYKHGRRELLELVVPEPAAMYRYTARSAGSTGQGIEEPPEPLAGTDGLPAPTGVKLSPDHIRPETYRAWVAKYQVSSVSPPPSTYTTIAEVLEGSGSGTEFVKTSKALKVPAGYKAVSNFTACTWHPAGNAYLAVLVGTWGGFVWDAVQPANNSTSPAMAGEDGEIPIAAVARGVSGYTARIEVVCENVSKLAQWQLTTYEAVMQAYLELRQAYDAHVAGAMVGQGIVIQGRNPAGNRSVERRELKRAAVSVLTGQHFDSFGAVRTNGDGGYPEIDFAEADAEGAYAQFFEQAIEWGQMTYLYYPYFWADKSRWLEMAQTTDIDPLFQAFLQAGAARVVVPVRPGYEATLGHYLTSPEGQIWNGADPPTVDDPLFVSIAEELKEDQGVAAGAVPDGEPWEVVVPTDLVLLQEGTDLPDCAAQA